MKAFYNITFYDIVNGLTLFYVLFNTILMAGGRRFWNWLNQWQRNGVATVPVFFLAGLYVFGGIGTGFAFEFARASGKWYAPSYGIVKIMFEILFFACVILMAVGRERTKKYIRNSFWNSLFMLFSGVLGFGCCVSFILIHWVKLGLV